MPSCDAINFIGKKCGISTEQMPYFWFYDGNKRINKVFNLCQQHSNELINSMLHSEQSYNNLLEKLYKKAATSKNRLNDKMTYDRHNIVKKDVSEIWEKIHKFQKLKNKLRNHTCRYCDYALKEPESKDDQVGKTFSHADFHSPAGYRREVLLFHTECGISFILSKLRLNDKELSYVRPKLQGQTILQ